MYVRTQFNFHFYAIQMEEYRIAGHLRRSPYTWKCLPYSGLLCDLDC